MASLFSAPGQLINSVRGMDLRTMATTFSYQSVIIYIVVFAIIGFIVFMLLGKEFDLRIIDLRPMRMKVLDDAQVFWQKMPLSKKFVVPEDTMENFRETKYTCLMDIVLKNTRPRSGGNVYRHLYHRGSEDLASSTLPAYGLPKRMNPGVFLDPNVNDILVYVDTVKNGTTFRESLRISDIPLDIPFRLAVMVSRRILEVYINCKLETTKLLDGDPKEVENAWYGLSGGSPAEAQLQNLTIWRRPLIIDEITHMCPPKLLVFNMAEQVCESDKPTMDIDGMKTKLVDKFKSAKDQLKGFL